MNPFAVIAEEIGREVAILRKSEGWRGKAVGCLCVTGTAVAMILVVPVIMVLRLVVRLSHPDSK